MLRGVKHVRRVHTSTWVGMTDSSTNFVTNKPKHTRYTDKVDVFSQYDKTQRIIASLWVRAHGTSVPSRNKQHKTNLRSPVF